MKTRRQLHHRSLAILALVACGSIAIASSLAPNTVKNAKAVKTPMLYVVGYSHLDTEWCWTYPQVIREFIPDTLRQNFALFDKYPNYVFNWTGSNRYHMMMEYYPEDYARLKTYVAKGQWFPGGSSVEEGDVNSPSEESLVRQVLYGNEFFRKQFGIASEEFTLPDCFGFPASLPSILAHCGLKGFSTQKLTWGSAVGIPFNVGNWIGPDGVSIVAALNATAYDSGIDGNLKQDPTWVRRMAQDQAKTGVAVDFRYYGVGDRGGSVEEKDLKNLLLSEQSPGPFNIYAGRMDKMFTDLSVDQKAKLPNYEGDLELTQHSAGSLTSEATQKKWNRDNEILADDTERASVAADWLGAQPYDKDRITDAWLKFLPGQFHDLMAGTALPLAYTYSWNDEVIAMNEFAGVLRTAVGGVSRAMDTTGRGVPLVIYNPLSIQRTDAVEATVTFPGAIPTHISVVGPNGTVPSQEVSRSGNRVKLLILATVPSIGFASFHVVGSSGTPAPSNLHVTTRTVENDRYRVTLNDAGDIASILDKKASKELLAAPARLEYQHENPSQFPAWNMDWADQSKPPADYVSGTPSFKIVENGPVRVGLEVTRRHKGSTFIQTIRLSPDRADGRIELATKIDWQGKESALKADFPLTVSNPQATYNWGLGTVRRGNNDPKKYEVASHQWFDLTGKDNAYGVSILDQAKYGSDKPSDNDLRLTLLYSPGVRAGYQHQAEQDWGHHEFVYAIEGHKGTWQTGRTQWESARLSQPLLAFQTSAHSGSVGKAFSLAHVNNPNISIEALKKSESGNELIVRINELSGSDQHGIRIGFASPIVSAREVDGQERELGPAAIQGGQLAFDTTAYHPRAFAIRLAGGPVRMGTPKSTPLSLPYNLDAISTWSAKTDGNFDGAGKSLPGELMPSTIDSDGVIFKLGPKTSHAKNAVIARGQLLQLPVGTHRKLYVLAASANGDTQGTFLFPNSAVTEPIQAWDGTIGEWDTRLWDGKIPELTYDWHNAYAGLTPGHIKRATVAWYADHRRLADGTNDIYAYAYLFRTAIPVPDGAKWVRLPNNESVRILAATLALNPNEDTVPAQPLYDNLGHAAPQLPGISPSEGSFSDVTTVSVSRPVYWSESQKMRYTLDGSRPTAQSPVFTAPIKLYQPTTLTVAQFDENGIAGPAAVAHLNVQDVTPPSVTGVTAAPLSPSITVTFSEAVDPTSGSDASHYSLQSGKGIQSATLNADGTAVVLRLAQPITDGSDHLKISGVKDRSPAGNTTETERAVELLKPVYEASDVQSFSGTAVGRSERNISGLPTKAAQPWTINMFVWVDKTPKELTPVAGVGDGRDRPGAERFIIKFNDTISFWASDVDLHGSKGFDLHRWQMVSVSYDGATLRLYKDGELIGSESADLTDAQNVVRFAPRPAWSYGAEFAGKVAGFTVWTQALGPEVLKGLQASAPSEKTSN